MNIFRSMFEKHLLQFAFKSTNFSEKNHLTKLVRMYQLPVRYQIAKTGGRKISLNPVLQKLPWQLPSKYKEMVFTFPGAKQQKISVPGVLANELLKKFDPLPLFQIPIRLPQQSPMVEVFAGERMLKIRRHKMRKHKRRKRYDRDYFKYQKYHRQKKAKAENIFRSRMHKMIEDYKAFDPEKYIANIIACAKQDVTKDVSPSGRRKYPHWSTIITLEELYGLPQTDYIDKNAGLAGDEDREKIRQLKKEYDEKYRVCSTRISCFQEDQQKKQDSFDRTKPEEKEVIRNENSKTTCDVDKTKNDDQVKS